MTNRFEWLTRNACFRVTAHLRQLLTCLAVLIACAIPTSSNGQDLDQDGLDDAFEESLASGFLATHKVWFSAPDGCPGPLNPKPVLYRAHPLKVQGIVDANY